MHKQNKFHATPLVSAIHDARRLGFGPCLQIIKQLLCREPAQFSAVDTSGPIALHEAALSGFGDVLADFLQSGRSDVNSRDHEGSTLLMAASRGQSAETVRLLLASGEVEVNAENDFGSTALFEAVGWRRDSKESSMLETARLLLDSGADANAVNGVGDSPLWHFLKTYCYQHHNDMILPLEPPTMARMLIDAKARADVVDHEGGTALMYAAQAGASSVVNLLLTTSSALPKVRNHSGQSAFDIALRSHVWEKQEI